MRFLFCVLVDPPPYNIPLIFAQGKFTEAGPLYERSQAILEKVLGPEQPQVAIVLSHRACLLSEQVKAIRIS